MKWVFSVLGLTAVFSFGIPVSSFAEEAAQQEAASEQGASAGQAAPAQQGAPSTAAPPGSPERVKGAFAELQRTRRSATFDRMDQNGDQKVSLDEFKAFQEKQSNRIFESRDEDDDGLLSRDEFVKMTPGGLRMRGAGGAPPAE